MDNSSYDDNDDCFYPLCLEPYVIGDVFMWNQYDVTTATTESMFNVRHIMRVSVLIVDQSKRNNK